MGITIGTLSLHGLRRHAAGRRRLRLPYLFSLGGGAPEPTDREPAQPSHSSPTTAHICMTPAGWWLAPIFLGLCLSLTGCARTVDEIGTQERTASSPPRGSVEITRGVAPPSATEASAGSHTPDLPVDISPVPSEPLEFVALEDCATRVMRAGRSAGAVVRECSEQIDGYTAHLDSKSSTASLGRPVPEDAHPAANMGDPQVPHATRPRRPGESP
jgi:hypothetical protein